MGQIRGKVAIGNGASDAMAVDARSLQEEVVASDDVSIFNGVALLIGDPRIPLPFLMDNDGDEHVCMLSAAVLGALADIGARHVGFEPRGG